MQPPQLGEYGRIDMDSGYGVWLSVAYLNRIYGFWQTQSKMALAFQNPFVALASGFGRIFEQNLWLLAEFYLNRNYGSGFPESIDGSGIWRIFE